MLTRLAVLVDKFLFRLRRLGERDPIETFADLDSRLDTLADLLGILVDRDELLLDEAPRARLPLVTE